MDEEIPDTAVNFQQLTNWVMASKWHLGTGLVIVFLLLNCLDWRSWRAAALDGIATARAKASETPLNPAVKREMDAERLLARERQQAETAELARKLREKEAEKRETLIRQRRQEQEEMNGKGRVLGTR